MYVASIISLGGNIMYAVATLKGKIKPNITSWILWSLPPIIIFAVQRSQGVDLQALLSLAVGLSPVIIVISALVKANGKFKPAKLDIICAVIASSALAVWLITGKANLAIILSILAGCAAGLPTLMKAYSKPKSESAVPFICGSVSAIITLLTLQTFSLDDAAFAVYLLISNLILVFFIAIRPHLSSIPTRQQDESFSES